MTRKCPISVYVHKRVCVYVCTCKQSCDDVMSERVMGSWDDDHIPKGGRGSHKGVNKLSHKLQRPDEVYGSKDRKSKGKVLGIKGQGRRESQKSRKSTARKAQSFKKD